MLYTICIRLEDIKISERGRYCRDVCKVMFKGGRNDYVVKSDGVELIVAGENGINLSVGEKIKFDIKRHQIIT